MKWKILVRKGNFGNDVGKASEKMSEKEGTNERTIERDLAKLKKMGILTREGGRKEGKWIIKIEK
ncbi:MAG: hypothetical protein J5698_00395 [Bacteroidaceae bacterium]|nr:hypothetical protein [Bacteroidaceae bacterium]